MARLAPTAPVVFFGALALALLEPDQSIRAGAMRRALMDPALVELGVRQLGISESTYLAISVGRAVALSALLFAVAFAIALRASEYRAAIIFAFTFSAFGFLLFVDVLGPVEGPGGPVLAVTSLLYMSFFFAFYAFPDGRLWPRWTRWLLLGWGFSALGVAFPGSFLDQETWHPLAGVATVLVLFLSCPLAIILRYRRQRDPIQRQQIKWVAFGLALMVVVWAGFWITPNFIPSLQSNARAVAIYDIAGGLVLGVGYAAVPLTVALALMRRRLWEIDPIVGRTVVYSLLTVSVVAIYVAVVGYVGALLHVEETTAVSLVAAAIVAVLFHPLREFLQGRVNRVVYGQIDDPYEAIVGLGRRLELTSQPAALLPEVATTVRRSLRVPYVSLAVGPGPDILSVASSGTPTGTVIERPLAFGGETVGILSLSTRAAGADFSRRERRLLDDFASQASALAHAITSSTELQRARESLVEAREEERRRLSQELHDGLGPLLASQPLTIAAAKRALHGAPQATTDLLDAAIAHAQSAVEDVRRIVLGLRPSTLASLGLAGSLQALAHDLGSDDLELTVELPDSLPEMTAAAEVACYRIVQEALTNVVRHAGASKSRVRIEVDEVLRLSVEDNGTGIAAGVESGVGLASMRRRAEELGGTFLLDSTPQGTQIAVSLPLAAP